MEHTWLDREEYPFISKHFQINGHRLHYIDEGAGEILLFVHGTPSWSFDFRYLITHLSDEYRCIAIDHIGFGLSDKPSDYNYSTQNHARTLEQFIIEKGLQDITIVLHDFGGPIGMYFATRHPGLVKRFVIMNTWMWSSRGEPEFAKLSKILKSPLLSFLYKQLNFSPRFLLPASFGANKLSRELLTQYTKPFRNASERNGPLAFARSLLIDQDWFEDLWQQKVIVKDKPALLVWGMKDKFATPKYLDKFVSGFKNNTVVRLDTCGHFPQEEEATAVLKAMAEWLISNVSA